MRFHETSQLRELRAVGRALAAANNGVGRCKERHLRRMLHQAFTKLSTVAVSSSAPVLCADA